MHSLIHKSAISGLYTSSSFPKPNASLVFADIQTTAINYIHKNQHLLLGQDFIFT